MTDTPTEAEYEAAARKLGFIDHGIWGIHNPSAAEGFGPYVYASWKECCERENIAIETVK